MYNLSSFKIKADNGDVLVIDNNVRKALESNMYHVYDSDGFFVCSLYWADDEGGLVYSHDNTPKAKFIIEQILAAILN